MKSTSYYQEAEVINEPSLAFLQSNFNKVTVNKM